MIIQAPASKSYLQRALAIALLAKGKTILNNVSWCDDSLVVKKLIAGLGAKVTENKQQVTIHSHGLQAENNFYSIGESGLALRAFCPIVALTGKEITLSGSGSLEKRPVDFVVQPLKQAGVDIMTNGGFPPLTVKHKLTSGKITMDGSVSSQLLTGLLIALPLVDGDSEIVVENLKSIPYIDMTLEIVKHFGIQINHNNYKHFFIKGNQTYQPLEYIIEGDWSGAAFFLVAGALTGGIEVTNLSKNSLQADKNITEALKRANTEIIFGNNSVIAKKKNLTAFDFDATHCPDLFPPLAALAAKCKGVTTVKGVSRLKNKESNRGEVIKNELSKLGIKVHINGDLMKITGGKIQGGTINPHNDHRIAMMGGVLNLIAENKIIIENKDVVNKSYPNFFVDLNRISKK